jgi:uncharacterized protein (TIGR03118 family)
VLAISARGLRLTAATALGGLALAGTAVAAPSDQYVQRNMVSSNLALVPADREDRNVVNPWGLAASATSPWWPANAGSNTSTIIPATGAVNTTVVAVPGGPTGIVAGPGGAGNFAVSFLNANGTTNTGPSNFIFNTMGGVIYGWRGGVPQNNAIVGISRASVGAMYMGLANATVAGAPRLYAADFRNNRIDVVNAQWGLVDLGPGAFVDPNLPAGYGAYGIQTIGNRIFVTYARQPGPGQGIREIPGAGLGVVNAFDLNGGFLARVAGPGGVLNAPWGTARADPNFGAFGGDLLIGNFGDGRINAFRENADGTWSMSGTLKALGGAPLVIQGLWALQPGNGVANNGARNHIYFTAGPFGETQGLFGRLLPNPSEAGGNVPATLSLTLSGPASFGAFTPGVAADYLASTAANVISSAGDATLSVSDASSTATGRLVNGTFSLAAPIQAAAASAGGTAAPMAAVGGSSSPTTLLTYTGPVSNDAVTLSFKQTVGVNEALRTGTYSKTLTFTLSTTQP